MPMCSSSPAVRGYGYRYGGSAHAQYPASTVACCAVVRCLFGLIRPRDRRNSARTTAETVCLRRLPACAPCHRVTATLTGRVAARRRPVDWSGPCFMTAGVPCVSFQQSKSAFNVFGGKPRACGIGCLIILFNQITIGARCSISGTSRLVSLLLAPSVPCNLVGYSIFFLIILTILCRKASLCTASDADESSLRQHFGSNTGAFDDEGGVLEGVGSGEIATSVLLPLRKYFSLHQSKLHGTHYTALRNFSEPKLPPKPSKMIIDVTSENRAKKYFRFNKMRNEFGCYADEQIVAKFYEGAAGCWASGVVEFLCPPCPDHKSTAGVPLSWGDQTLPQGTLELAHAKHQRLSAVAGVPAKA